MRMPTAMRKLRWTIALISLAGFTAFAQTTPTIWQGVYTSAQATRGEAVYTEHCAECHREDLTGQDMSPSLVGIGFTFKWEGKNLQELYASMRYGMPQTAPGSLSNSEYAALTAFLLSRNGFPAGEAELSPNENELATIAITGNR
jgi:mono/diheme cytochrome c family protein